MTSELLSDLPSLRETVAEFGLSAKKSLGQNFLFDHRHTDRIAEAACASGSVVYEVGPGPGGLTRSLINAGARRVIAVERDERCVEALEQLRGFCPDVLTIAPADALKIDENKLLNDLGIPADEKFAIAANLPYNIATQLLVKWLTAEWPPRWRSLTLMFQKEVAQRIVAGPGSKAYGRVSVLTGWRCRSEILFELPPGAFVPAPKVSSAVVHIEPLDQPVGEVDLKRLEQVTAAAFGQRRKMLRQSLKSLTKDAAGLLAEAGIDETRRAETLSVEEFVHLALVWTAVAARAAPDLK